VVEFHCHNKKRNTITSSLTIKKKIAYCSETRLPNPSTKKVNNRLKKKREREKKERIPHSNALSF
jgi:hypothetical protein